jgi:adenylate cyclase
MASLATLVPALAILGVVNAGLDVREAVLRGSIDVSHLAPGPAGESLGRIVYMISTGYLALLIAVFGLRAARDWHGRRFGAVRITYPGRRVVAVPAGFSVLEASRWAGIAHESVCGGRGRCSTCRVRVLQGADRLAAPDALELRTLRRIAAAPDVRLACQLRPANDIAVQPLVRPRSADAAEAIRFGAAVGGGRELEIAAMFVDLRGSTELATDRLPYDALFLFDRYVQAVTGVIRAHGGHVTSVAGDGIMSVFGTDRQDAARQALRSALDIWKGLDALNNELASELAAPLKFGIGLHVGTSVVGWISTGASQSLQFLGDTGNVAAKLEARSKDFDCALVVSAAALDAAAAAAPALEMATVKIAGRTTPMNVAVVRQRIDLERLVAELPVA